MKFKNRNYNVLKEVNPNQSMKISFQLRTLRISVWFWRLSIGDYLNCVKYMEAIIFARVSTQEQAQEGYSVDGQVVRLTEYCKKHNFNIIETFRVAESSSKDEKKEFNRMINLAKTRKSKVAIVVDKVDRLNRSVKDLPKLEELMTSQKAELHFLDIGRLDSEANTVQKLMLRIMTAIGNTYSDNLSDHGKRTYQHKVDNGECPGHAPIGYLNARDEAGRATVIVDSARAFLVTKIFEMYAAGIYSLGDLAKFAHQNNLTNTFYRHNDNKSITKNVISGVLKNRFYCGFICHKKSGRLYPHKYERLISRELFEACQRVTAERSAKNNRVKSVSTMKAGKEFIFKGLVRCGVTGRISTCDRKDKRGIDAGTYLIAWNPEATTKKVWVNEKVLLDEMAKIFQSMTIPVKMIEDVVENLNRQTEDEINFAKAQLESLNRQLGNLLTRGERLLDMKLDGQIDGEIYDRKRKEIEEEIKKTRAGIERHQTIDNGFKKYVISAFSLASRVYELFQNANLSEKRELINCVFSDIILHGKNPRFSLREPFHLMINLGECTDWLPIISEIRTCYFDTVNKMQMENLD